MKQIYIFCEGKTEYNYIQSLNRLLERCDVFDIRFTPKYLEGLRINNCLSKIRGFKARELRYFDHFYAWLDYDIFKRGGKSDEEIKAQIKEISFNGKQVNPLFNYMNGEDFMILHEEDSKIEQWKAICNKNKHFNTPMIDDIYLPLFKSVMPKYKKGTTPDLDKEKIESCIKNIDDTNIPFKSDIKELLEEILEKITTQ